MTIVSPPQRESAAVPARTQPWLVISAVAIAWGSLAFVVLHLLAGRNPLVEAVSFYAFADQAPGLLAVSILLVAVGSATTLAALSAARFPLSRVTRVLFVLWAGGLALAAVFPVSYGELSSVLSGEIHQYSCVAAFLSMPAIGFSLLRQTRATPALAGSHASLTRWTLYSAVSMVLFAVSYLIAKQPDVPVLAELSSILPVGLTQRVTLAVDIGLLCSIVQLARRAGTSSPA